MEEDKIGSDSSNSANEHEGHDFDGITELNNPAPNWIVLVFIATIGFSLFYLITYFGYPGSGNDQASEYAQKSAAFDKEKKQQQEAATGGVVMGEQERIASGSQLFLQKGCIACHGMKGEGNKIGPNLTDNYWLNGCSEANVVTMISEGKPEKGMTPFKAMMTGDEIKNVALYIRKTLVGSNPENAKAPQGVECKP